MVPLLTASAVLYTTTNQAQLGLTYNLGFGRAFRSGYNPTISRTCGIRVKGIIPSSFHRQPKGETRKHRPDALRMA